MSSCYTFFKAIKISLLLKVIPILLTTSLVTFNSFSQCYTSGQNLPNVGYTLSTSGYKNLDSIVFQEINNLQGFFGVKIDFYFLLEEYNANAMYNPTCIQNCNGTVFLGIKMLYNQLQKEHGVECVKAILAHEFGHCLQYLMGWDESGKRRELHSDFLAGYYVGKMYNHSEEQLRTLYSEFYSMGAADDEIFNPDYHGSSLERGCSFSEGYCYAKETNTNVTTANDYAFLYVAANNPCALRKYNQYVKDISEGKKGNIKFKVNDKKTYVISYKDVDGQIKRYRLKNDNPILSIPDMSINFKYIFTIYEETKLSGLLLVNELKIQPGQNLVIEINIDNWKIKSRQYRIINDYSQVSKSNKYTFKFSSPDEIYYIFDAQDKYIGKITPESDLFIYTPFYEFNYFNIYRFQNEQLYFEEEISSGIFNVPQNGMTNIQISKKNGIKQSLIYP
jgi:hypothetical protein